MARIFLADDEKFILSMLVMNLQEQGHVVVGCASSLLDAQEKLGCIVGGQMDLVILDGEMPNKGDGAALADAIRAKFPGIRVASYAGQDETFGDKGLNFRKPYPGVLLKAVSRLFPVP